MKQKLFSLFAAVLCAANVMASDIKVDGIWYNFDESTLTATVTFRGSAYYSFTNEYAGGVVIPDTVTYNEKDYAVTSIGEYAFYGCTGLTSITCEASTPPACGSNVFDGVDKSIPLYVPAESVEAYKAAD